MIQNSVNQECDAEIGTGPMEPSRVCPPVSQPACWYGAACRKLHDPVHCAQYSHETRPCKFGTKCRRKGRGCKYQHPVSDAQNAPLLNLNTALNHNDRNEVNGNGNGLATGGPEPERPVPFIILLICVCALGLVGLPVLGECDSSMHQRIFYAGGVLCMPLMLLELLLLTCRSLVLRCFLEGEYSERATFRRLSCLWYPEQRQLLRYTEGDNAGNNIEQYATWETNDLQQQVEVAMGGNRDGGQVTRTSGGFHLDFPGAFQGSGVTINRDGSFDGLQVPATFDGSTIVSGEGAWSKAGYWRLDWVTKLCLLLFVLGVECAFVAILMPPGVKGLGGLDVHGRMPLNVVFVVDGSASITDHMWKAQKTAGEEFIDAFQRDYGDEHGELNMGLVQFSTEARTEEPLTSDIQAVLTKFANMQQMEAWTYFDKGLSLCKSNLESYQTTQKSFDVCVLITDGVDMSGLEPAALQGLLPVDTAIFGIFVGSDDKGIKLLESITECGRAKSSSHECDFFASASDYAVLSSRADEVSAEVIRGVDLATCAEMSALIGVPTAICMCLPYILLYASMTGLTLWKRRHGGNNYRSLKNNINNNFA